MAGRAAEKCVERWCNAFDIQFRIFQDFLCGCHWLERLFIMKNGNQHEPYSSLFSLITYQQYDRCM